MQTEWLDFHVRLLKTRHVLQHSRMDDEFMRKLISTCGKYITDFDSFTLDTAEVDLWETADNWIEQRTKLDRIDPSKLKDKQRQPQYTEAEFGITAEQRKQEMWLLRFQFVNQVHWLLSVFLNRMVELLSQFASNARLDRSDPDGEEMLLPGKENDYANFRNREDVASEFLLYESWIRRLAGRTFVTTADVQECADRRSVVNAEGDVIEKTAAHDSIYFANVMWVMLAYPESNSVDEKTGQDDWIRSVRLGSTTFLQSTWPLVVQYAMAYLHFDCATKQFDALKYVSNAVMANRRSAVSRFFSTVNRLVNWSSQETHFTPIGDLRAPIFDYVLPFVTTHHCAKSAPYNDNYLICINPGDATTQPIPSMAIEKSIITQNYYVAEAVVEFLESSRDLQDTFEELSQRLGKCSLTVTKEDETTSATRDLCCGLSSSSAPKYAGQYVDSRRCVDPNGVFMTTARFYGICWFQRMLLVNSIQGLANHIAEHHDLLRKMGLAETVKECEVPEMESARKTQNMLLQQLVEWCFNTSSSSTENKNGGKEAEARTAKAVLRAFTKVMSQLLSVRQSAMEEIGKLYEPEQNSVNPFVCRTFAERHAQLARELLNLAPALCPAFFQHEVEFASEYMRNTRERAVRAEFIAVATPAGGVDLEDPQMNNPLQRQERPTAAVMASQETPFQYPIFVSSHENTNNFLRMIEALCRVVINAEKTCEIHRSFAIDAAFVHWCDAVRTASTPPNSAASEPPPHNILVSCSDGIDLQTDPAVTSFAHIPVLAPQELQSWPYMWTVALNSCMQDVPHIRFTHKAVHQQQQKHAGFDHLEPWIRLFLTTDLTQTVLPTGFVFHVLERNFHRNVAFTSRVCQGLDSGSNPLHFVLVPH